MAGQKRRKFVSEDNNGKRIELAIIRPNQAILNESDLHYNVSLNKALRLGSMMKSEAMEMIEKRGIWTEKDEKKIEEKRIEMMTKEAKLYDKKTTKEAGIRIAFEIRELRSELVSIMAKRSQYLYNTAEYYAENIRDQYLAAVCTIVADTGDQYFSDFDDYLLRSEEQAATDAYRETVYMMNGFDAMEHNNFVENKYLIDNGKMNESGELISGKETAELTASEEEDKKEDRRTRI